MIKVADKPSTDPVQQKLRQLKKQWNKDVSIFIDNLIHYKKLTNGQPNKFFKERSSIKEPIPADPSTILGSLAGDFQELVQRGNAIIAAQVDYSKTRRKSQPKTPVTNLVVPTTPASDQTPDLSKQLAAFENKYELISEASNPITRFFTRLLTPTFGVSEAARIRKYRISLLDACVKAYKSAGKFQVEIVKSSPASVHSANKQLHQFWNDWMLVYRGFSTYKSNMPPVVSDAGGDIAAPKDLVKDKVEEINKTPDKIDNVPSKEKSVDDLMGKAKNIINDYVKNNRRIGSDKMPGLEVYIAKLTKSPREYQPILAEQLINEYNNLIAKLNSEFTTSGTTLAEIAQQIEKKKESPVVTAEVHLEKVSQDFLKKWVGKTRHQLSLFDKSSAYRLDAYKMAGEIRNTLDKMMNSLEKDMNTEELQPLVQQVNQQVTSLRGLMRAMHNAGSSATKTHNENDAMLGPLFDSSERFM